jgi:hypothetical protein
MSGTLSRVAIGVPHDRIPEKLPHVHADDEYLFVTWRSHGTLPAAQPDKRLGISTSLACRLHGDLARAIAARHLRQRTESMEQRREVLRSDVFAIVKNSVRFSRT